MHIGLHIPAITSEYASTFNCDVLARELKHKVFKIEAAYAAPSNLMAYLFSKDVVRQSIRLGLAESWAQQIPELEEHLDAIRQQCPKLVNSFIPLTE
jgi:hypothetical protein